MTDPADPRLVRALACAQEYAEGYDSALGELRDLVAKVDAELQASAGALQHRLELAARLLVRAGSREFDDRPPRNAPGHRHKAAPYWDLDGRKCDWCAAWNDLYLALRALDK